MELKELKCTRPIAQPTSHSSFLLFLLCILSCSLLPPKLEPKINNHTTTRTTRTATKSSQTSDQIHNCQQTAIKIVLTIAPAVATPPFPVTPSPAGCTLSSHKILAYQSVACSLAPSIVGTFSASVPRCGAIKFNLFVSNNFPWQLFVQWPPYCARIWPHCQGKCLPMGVLTTTAGEDG